MIRTLWSLGIREPRGIVHSIITKSRNDADDRTKIAEQGDSRLQLRSLICGEPVLTVDLDILELDKRCTADSGNVTSRRKCLLPFAQLDQSPAHADELFPVGVEVHVAEKQNRVAFRICTRCDMHTDYGNPAAA